MALLSASTAQAGTLVTAALRPGVGKELSCLITNTTTRDLAVVIEMIRHDGSLIGQASPTLGPSETYDFHDPSDSTSPTHCRFELNGNSKSARALACIGTASAGCTAVAPAQ